MSRALGPEGRTFRGGDRHRASARPAGPAGRQVAASVAVRVTGLALAVLVLGHFTLTHLVTDVAEADARYIARRWQSALWLVWDWTMLATALFHGAAGVWLAIEDYSPDPRRRRWRQRVLVAVTVALLVLGTVTLAAGSRAA